MGRFFYVRKLSTRSEQKFTGPFKLCGNL